MRILLDFYFLDKNLYLYEHNFSEYPILLLQVKVLLNLEEGIISNAKIAWNELQALAPEMYQDEFVYMGDKCIFSLCLRKLLDRSLNTLRDVDLTELNKREELIIKILLKSTTPVRKEELYFSIWGRSVETKADLDKLAKIVYRIRKKGRIKIQTKKGCYCLVAESYKNAG